MPPAAAELLTRRRRTRWVGALLAVALLAAGVVGYEVVGRSDDGPRQLASDPVAPVITPSPSAAAPAPPSPAAPPPAASFGVAPRADPTIRSAAQPDLDVESVLGPPPGPQVDPRPAAVAPPAARFALLVGVTDYRAPTVDTIGSAQDARFIAVQLEAAGWLPGNIRVLTDADATGAAVREGLTWLTERSVPGTFSLFHYSGHVKQKGGTSEALWPVDRAFLADTDVAQSLGRAKGRLWVDIAGCEAGSFADGLDPARVLFTGSSKQTEKSYEYPDWGKSIWTGLVFDLGLRQGKADADGDARTTLGESLRYAQYYAQAISLGQKPYGRQTPVIAGPVDLGWTLADPPA